MRWPEKLVCAASAAALSAALCGALFLSGCGTPGAPQPPSLNLPDPVGDLKAIRTGDRVTLTWTMPRRNTDKLLLKGPILVQIRRREAAAGPVTVATLELASGADGTFTETLPPPLAAGPLRPLTYFVELPNRRARFAGPSNEAAILAGPAPAPVVNLAAEVRKSGIVLRWSPADPSFAIRLERRLVGPPAAQPPEDPLRPPREPALLNLLVDRDTGIAIDREIRFGETYEYRAQRLARLEIAGAAMELAGNLSAPVRVQPLDVFPPARPTGLAAVATAAAANSPAAIDLNWQAGSEPDLAGYYVYRREAESPWRRISGDKPVPAPAWHDTQVLPGQTYIYAVSAVDAKGNESQRSEDATETVPPQ